MIWPTASATLKATATRSRSADLILWPIAVCVLSFGHGRIASASSPVPIVGEIVIINSEPRMTLPSWSTKKRFKIEWIGQGLLDLHSDQVEEPRMAFGIRSGIGRAQCGSPFPRKQYGFRFTQLPAPSHHYLLFDEIFQPGFIVNPPAEMSVG